MLVLRNDSYENADWMHSLPGYKDELKITLLASEGVSQKHLQGKHDQLSHGSWSKRRGDSALELNIKRQVGMNVIPSTYRFYPNAAAVRAGLVDPIKPLQDRMDELDVKIKDYTKKISEVSKQEAELEHRYVGRKYPDDVREELRELDRQKWNLRFGEQYKLQKEREKLSKQRDRLSREWLEAMRAQTPLDPKIESGAAQIEKLYLDYYMENSGGVEPPPEEKQKVMDTIHKLYILDADNESDMVTFAWVQKTINTVSSVVEKSALGDNQDTPVLVGTDQSGSYYRTENKVLHVVNTYHSKSVIASTAHEFGHWLEDRSPTARKRLNQFYERRTDGETEKPLKKGSKTMVKKDKFIDPYVGRGYKKDDGGLLTTEVLSVGMEILFSDPYRLASKDPEMFDLVVSIIRGIPEK